MFDAEEIEKEEKKKEKKLLQPQVLAKLLGTSKPIHM